MATARLLACGLLCVVIVVSSSNVTPASQLEEGLTRKRSPVGWVWNQFFVLEEYMGTEPIRVGRVHLEADKDDGSVQYELQGDGAGTVFTVDKRTGEVFVSRKLDRETQARYRLLARAWNSDTSKQLAPPSHFMITVQDVNDNPPIFDGDQPYLATVQEMASPGTLVRRVEATDADDPSYGNAAKLVYSLMEGGEHFTINATTGDLRTAHGNLDRELSPWLRALVTARDMGGMQGGLVATATVTVTLGDVNDNAPRFTNASFELHVGEGARPGEEVGRVSAIDPDEGPNAEATFRLVAGPSSGRFRIHTDPDTNQGVVTLAGGLDFETQSTHVLRVSVENAAPLETRGSRGASRDPPAPHTATVLVRVRDEDEPPVFSESFYRLRVSEERLPGVRVGSVTARDPDRAGTPVRYRIEGEGGHLFSIHPETGEILTKERLDRETVHSHNVTVSARELGMPALETKAWVHVTVTDVNDNAPQPEPSVGHTCDQVTEGQELMLLGAVDLDEAHNGRPFNFSFSDSHPNITLRDNGDSTASVLSRLAGELPTSPLALLVTVSDSGSPPLTGSGRVTLHACRCPEGYGEPGSPGGARRAHVCSVLGAAGGQAWAGRAGLSAQAIAAVIASLMILAALLLTLLAVKRRCYDGIRPDCADSSDAGDILRENIIAYDDEGGGEEDTRAFDVSALAPRALPRSQRHAADPRACRGDPGADRGEARVAGCVNERLRRADLDECHPPFDSVQVYGDEGSGSLAGSLSSLGSGRGDDDGGGGCDGKFPESGSLGYERRDACYDYLNEWGPRFEKLAQMYAYGGDDEEEED